MPRAPHCLTLLTLLSIATALLLVSCAGVRAPDGSVLVVDRMDVATWNPHNVWMQVASDPKSFVPRGMKPGAATDEAHGVWKVDPQDHLRFYVPHEGTTLFPHAVILDAAKTATHHVPKALIPFVITGQMIDGIANR